MNLTSHTIRFVALRAFGCALVTAIVMITGAALAFAQAQNFAA